ncbi:MAG TPA: HEAT repeat domain-containing protein, partial [Kofleriaceae bacterium]|nr:HEAT repeat domain-containing protein [Kofleriaceae bacterium]
PPLVASSPKLADPEPVDPSVRGAGYLTSLAQQLQPPWSQFLEDCRLRLPARDPLNHTSLAATADLVIDHAGKVVDLHVATSGNASFDRAIQGVIADAQPLVAPPPDLESDDDRVHLRWLFARDRRQAGPATAQVISVDMPLLPVVERLVRKGDLVRVARRIIAAPPTDPDRGPATERVMIAALREALGSADAAVRRAAADAIGRAKVASLSHDLAKLLAPTTDVELRLAAIDAIGKLGDPDAATPLIAELPGDLFEHDRLALAEARALVELGRADDVAKIVRTMLDADGATPHPIAVRALAVAPVAELATKLPRWFERGDARTRAAVCGALAGGTPAWSAILRGLRDPDAKVRATCAESAAKQARPRVDIDVIGRLRDLARDRDATVRARAIVALAALGTPLKLASDPAPEVRVALATTTADTSFANDPDAEVRAAAVAAAAARGKSLTSTDPAWQVRRAMIAGLDDGSALAKLLSDESPEVATAALVRLASLRGRAAMTEALLVRLASGSPGSSERVRTALAWLLAR